ncbi:MAG: M16 family metallopeptidase [Paludibacteraceae bacterium]
MRKIAIPCISTLAVCSISLSGNPLEVKTYTLPNGLTVWLNQDDSQPKVVGAVVVKAGAKDTPNTGIAHYFEHIMFKGTDKIGTTNYVAEKVYLDSISAKYDELALTKDATQRSEIQQAINRLSIEATQFSIPNEFDRLISKYGGTGLNAGTGHDMTMYYNTFSPQYFAQWCELNSERLMNPVFRGFQSELETVYEEKNMYSDALGYMAMEKVLEKMFSPHPYQYSIIGSTENLKNPRLSDMEDFFEKYYVAGNMGLILSGNFNEEQALPIIEKTFGRIRSGSVIRNETPKPTPFKEKESFTVKFPIPLVKATALVWRSVPTNHPDEIPLEIAMRVFSNSNQTGLLDKLTTDGKLMQAMGINMSRNDAGVVLLLAVPNIPFQSNNTAQKLVLKALERVKEGDFSDTLFNSLKMEQKRLYRMNLEKIDSRVNKMAALFSENKSWTDYVDEINRIDALTKQDVVKVVNTYFTANYLELKKKTGNYPNEKMQKPGFAPIEARNKEKQSDYAMELGKMMLPESMPRFLDYSKDGKTITLNDKGLTRLYHTENLINDVFSLDLNYNVGNLEMKEAEIVSLYLEYLGTDSMTVNEFKEKLQQLGSTISFGAYTNFFNIKVNGFDENFDKTVALLGDFLKHVKPDKSKLKQVVGVYNVSEKAIRSSSDELASAAFEKVKYGIGSSYLDKLSLSDVKKLTAESLLKSFQKILSTECDMHYIGRQKVDLVASFLKNNIETENITTKTNNPIFRERIAYQKPRVFFYNDAKATQSIVYGYVNSANTSSISENNAIELFNSYLGGSMSSLMFQEIREFRSLAYRAYSSTDMPPVNSMGKPVSLTMMLSTQADKTVEAVHTLDSIFKHVPFSENRLETAKLDIINYAYNNYPDFRTKTRKIASEKMIGFTDDSNKQKVKDTSKMTLDDLRKVYAENFENASVVYIVVGNQKKIDMKELEKLGEITVLKQKDILK